MSFTFSSGVIAKTPVIDIGISTSDKSSSLASNSTEVFSIQPPSGELWELLAIYFNVNGPGGTTGVHDLIMRLSDGTNNINLFWGEQARDVALKFEYNIWSSTSDQTPVNEISQITQIQNIKVVNGYYFEMAYSNWTDTNQTNTRSYKVWYLRHKI